MSSIRLRSLLQLRSIHCSARCGPCISRIVTQRRGISATPKQFQDTLNSSMGNGTEAVSDAAGFELNDAPLVLDEKLSLDKIDWTRSFHGLSVEAFAPEIADILMKEIDPDDVEIKPDGILYLPEIKYRRILNKAFGPGGWGLAPRGETIITPKLVTREYALVCHGRLVSIARGEQEYFDANNISTATEGCKSNALMRCCKDLGIASELWDPRFIRKFKKDMCVEQFVEHVVTKKKRKLWKRKDQVWEYPYKISTF
ncbi:mitochondrial genome maintenance MGM101-domain-containing protein [Lipomyces orientalis]|uniref:Mitochondrial genome maintenance MGM101-domain-containing protein n=1 Tax=Lipomyces orientalis TaxID=1233043 RepID=A0ACC3TIF7_9ASCO